MKRTIIKQVLTKNVKLKLPTCGGLTDGNLNHVKMTAKQYLNFKVRQFKADKTLVNFNANISVRLSTCGNYWACSIAVLNLVK